MPWPAVQTLGGARHRRGRLPGEEAAIYSFGLIVGPQTDPDTVLSTATRLRCEVVFDGGVLVRLDGGPGVACIAAAIERLGADGVVVHRVVELPTDPGSPARQIAEACTRAFVGRRQLEPVGGR